MVFLNMGEFNIYLKFSIFKGNHLFVQYDGVVLFCSNLHLKSCLIVSIET